MRTSALIRFSLGVLRLSGNSANLDLLRACAVLSVYIGHLLRANHIDNIGPINVHNFAQTGVLIFFVHTSLVLMLSMERMGGGGRELATAFYVRRLFRIYPLSMLAVIFVVVFRVPRFFLILNYHWLGWPAFFSNLALTQNLTLSHDFLLPLWSLPLEVQMYVLLPPLFFLLKRYPGWRVPFALWCAGVFIASLQIHFHISQRLQLGAYVPFFLGGVIAFALSRYRPVGLPFWGWPLAIAVAYAIRQGGFRPGWFACLLLGVAAPQFKELANTHLRAVAAWVARYSYGIYLSHIIIFWYVLVVLGHANLLLRVGICALLSVTCPVLLYHLVEKPMINKGVWLANWIGRRRGPRVICSPVSESVGA